MIKVRAIGQKVGAIVPFKDTTEKDKNPFGQHVGTEYVLNFVSAKSKFTYVADSSSTKVVGKNQKQHKSSPLNYVYKRSTKATEFANKEILKSLRDIRRLPTQIERIHYESFTMEGLEARRGSM